MNQIIYALCEPGTDIVRYVGKTTNLKKRLREHRCEANGLLRTHKINWLRSLGGVEPGVIILAEIPGDGDWQAAEKHWIAEKRRSGSLTNFADGGQTSPVEGRGHSEETKEKLRNAALTRGCRPPPRNGAAPWNKGKPMSQATREKLSKALAGRKIWNKGVKKTHCKNGHEYSPENTRLYRREDRKQAYQICRTCEQNSIVRYNLRNPPTHR